MLKVGLTGGIGSGKTFVGNIFRALGVPLYVADLEARRLMEEDAALIDGVKQLLGELAYHSGKIDREYIASKVFGDKEMLEALNGVVHPAVAKDFEAWVMRQEGKYVMQEAAILFESGAYKRMDYSVVVRAGREERVRRVMNRDGVSEEDVKRRMGHQLSEEELLKRANFTIINDNDSMILPQIVDLHNKFLKVEK